MQSHSGHIVVIIMQSHSGHIVVIIMQSHSGHIVVIIGRFTCIINSGITLLWNSIRHSGYYQG